MLKHDLKVLWWLAAMGPVDWLATRARAAPDPRKVLIVRLDGIGDFVVWLDAAAGLRNLYPPDRYHVTLLGSRLWTGLARRQPIFDDVWEMDLNRFGREPGYRFELMRKVSKAGFSIGINPTYGRDFLWGDTIIRASGATQRIGIDGSLYRIGKGGKWLSDRWYTRLIATSDKPLAELERNAQFVRDLGATAFSAALPRTEVGQPPADLANRAYYVLCPVAGYGIRTWPTENFARLADRIFENTGWLGVVCGGPSDQETASRLKSATHALIVDYTGTGRIADTLDIIGGARLVVGNETGVIHLAVAAGTPSVCIVGGGHYGRFVPYPTLGGNDGSRPEVATHRMDCFGCDWRCIYQTSWSIPAPCISKVSVDAVWEKVLPILDGIRNGDAAVSTAATSGAAKS